MKKGNTRKPCPGCKEDPGYWGRPADGVCSMCEQLLTEAKARRLLIEIEKNQQEERAVYALPQRVTWPVHKVTHYSDWDDHPDSRLAKVFFAIAGKLMELNPPGVVWSDHKKKVFDNYYVGGSDRTAYAIATPENAELIGDLYRLIVECLLETYMAGKREGSSLLLNLASGDITLKQFNERSLQDK